jgi:hypothetical protein
MTLHTQRNAAIVTTLRNAGAALDSFVAYHRAIGFARLFLFFDDPTEADLQRARTMPDVTAIACDASLREIWKALPGYRHFGATADSEVMSRQLLNVEHAMGLARAAGFDWLLNIDADELFFSPNQSVAEHFAELDAAGVETISYLNYEAVPEREAIDDYFREVDLFKLPLGPVQDGLASVLQRAQRDVPQLTPFFHFYSNGKSAVRVSVDGVEPDGVHRFRRIGGRIAAARSARQFVLHYACCGFEAFWTKYATLGRFADRWWGRYAIAESIGTFHLEARDVVTLEGREKARAFYRERLAITDKARAEELIRLGLLTRLDQPRRILSGL